MDLSKLPKMTLKFKPPFAEPHLSITVNAPFPDVNPIFRIVAGSRIRPYSLAIENDMVSETTALRIFAEAYAEGVIDRSTTPGFEGWTIEQWRVWLLDHPDHFEELRAICEHRPNWNLPKEEPDGLGHLLA
ncbi:MAG: hypothetical protein WBG86_06270 [Polyangiales bacterium]